MRIGEFCPVSCFLSGNDRSNIEKPGFSEKKSTVDSLAFADVEGHDLTIASPFQHLSTSFLVKSFFSKRKKVAVSTTMLERVDTSYVLE